MTYYKSSEENGSKETCPYGEPIHNVRFGSIGTGSSWVQWHLKRYGKNIAVDGIFGIKSHSALLEFQEENNLEVDGICGKLTREKLRACINNTIPVVDKPATTPDVKPVKPNNGSCPYAEPSMNIKMNMTGDGVKWLQWWLNKHDAKPPLDVDGDFGGKTLVALNAFQKAAGLEVDGVCGKLTRLALKGEKIEVKEEDAYKGDEEYKKYLIQKREEMLDYIEGCVGGMYIYGGQHEQVTEELIDWSARCFPQYTTSVRAARMKKYLADHPNERISGTDCSGLFFLAVNKTGFEIIKDKYISDATAEGLYNQYCYPISKSELQPLDLVFNNDLTHVAVVVRGNKIAESMGSDVGTILNDNVDDRLGNSIYGPTYGANAQYWGSTWTKFGRLNVYKGIPYER